MVVLASIEAFDMAINHPYRSGEFLTDDDGNIYSVDSRDDVKERIEEANGNLYYSINWCLGEIETNLGDIIYPVYES